MEFKDYYDILGVTPDTDKQAIKKAYRRLARKFHPDVSSEANAEQKFKDVAEAYEVLGDDTRRAEYDQLRQYRSQGGEFTPPPGWQGFQQGSNGQHGDFSDFFASIFGGGFGQDRGFDFGTDAGFNAGRGRDVELELPVFLEESLKGDTRTIDYQLPQYGVNGGKPLHKTLKVKIPQGVGDGERIRLKGQGAPGRGDAPAGDLYLFVRLAPHPLFDVHGKDLSITLPVAPWEAALGARVEVPTLEGRIKLSVAPNSQTGTRLRVKGKGLPGKSGRGDLYVILKVVMPDKTSAENNKLWQQLSESAAFDPRAGLQR